MRMLSVVAIASLASCLALPALAGDCGTVMAALAAQAKISYAGSVTMLQSGQAPIQSEVIVTGGKMYVRVLGTWHVSEYSSEDVLKKMAESLKTAKLNCENSGVESVNGRAASVYNEHEENSGKVSDSRVWISDAGGLPLKLEMRFAGLPITQTIEYRYDNIVAPANAK